ncbi:unnamed protein product [Pleuronectes platessa]|uniref:Uncharacterized protein n=1 Tax=Pleuronectes platessa TaxID=8262 RepID=A0A9N7VDJ2_PLEPL|nr:unnamed protein product [Pleuronectes platessa]
MDGEMAEVGRAAGDGGKEGGVEAQWKGSAVLGLLVWPATPADMARHRGGFSGAKQPQGSAKEGTSLCGGGGNGIGDLGKGVEKLPYRQVSIIIRKMSELHYAPGLNLSS